VVAGRPDTNPSAVGTMASTNLHGAAMLERAVARFLTSRGGGWISSR